MAKLSGLFALVLAVAGALLVVPLLGQAQPTDRWPGISGFVAAQGLQTPKPVYPDMARNALSEGWVSLEYSIAPDGSVRDIAVVDALGPSEFVQTTIQAISAWRYKPATRNGVPVTQYHYTKRVVFLMEDTSREAVHDGFISAYNRARKNIKDGRIDEAIALLEETMRKPRSNLYELTNASFALALAHMQKRDPERALFQLNHALIEDLKYLDRWTRINALTLAVQLRGQTGDFSGALAAFKTLKEIDLTAASGRPAEVAGQIEAGLRGSQPLAVEVRLFKHPSFDAPGVWRHSLLRSKFSFAKIAGEVKSFRLSCVGAFHEAAVDAEHEWAVPAQAGPCMLRVDGTPGATFTFVEG